MHVEICCLSTIVILGGCQVRTSPRDAGTLQDEPHTARYRRKTLSQAGFPPGPSDMGFQKTKTPTCTYGFNERVKYVKNRILDLESQLFR